MDVVKYPDPSEASDFWIARTYHENSSHGYEITKIHCNDAQSADQPIVERFDLSRIRPNMTPGFCINRTDGIPQLLGFYRYDYYMVHYWRDPNTKQLVLQQSLWTKSFGSPAMICNRIPPYNLEVVYMADDGNYRFIWRGTENDWHEDHSLLKLPPGCSAVSEPVMTQTANGRIHVAAIVQVASSQGTLLTLAHWARDAHVGGDWNEAILYTGPRISQTEIMRPAIIALEQTGRDVVIICKSEQSHNYYLGGFKSNYDCCGNDLTLFKYPCELPVNVTGWGDNQVYNIAGIAGKGNRDGSGLFLTVTGELSSYYNNFFLVTNCAPGPCH